MGIRSLRGASALLFLSAAALALVACNAIVGVGDVTLKEDDMAIPTDDAGNPINPTDATVTDTKPNDLDAGGGSDSAVPPFMIVGGPTHTCAKDTSGVVKCWGGNVDGQLGNGAVAPDGGTAPKVLVPSPIVGLGSGMLAIASGWYVTCALKPDFSAACWGDDTYGQLGDGKTNTISSTPISVPGLSNVAQLSPGYFATCAVIKDGSVKCWGDNGYGLYGDGTKTTTTAITTVNGLTDAVQVGVGVYHACALRRGGNVVCWGQNNMGQLGNGGTGESLTPSAVSIVANATKLSVGYDFSCALLAGGSVMCWGEDDYGQLGNGTSIPYGTGSVNPVNVLNIASAVNVVAGYNDGCAVLQSGAVQCWGYDDDGELGNGMKVAEAGAPTSTPVNVVGVTDAVNVGGIFGLHACVHTKSGHIACWGTNDNGELGEDSESVHEYSPVNVVGYP